MLRIVSAVRDANFLRRDRIIAYGIILLIDNILILSYNIFTTYYSGTHYTALFPADFLVFYVAGGQADAHLAPLIYNISESFKAQAAVIGVPLSHGPQYFFFYPPVFILLCAVLAVFPYPVAFCIWNAATLSFLVVALRVVTRDWMVVFALLSFPALLDTVQLGQNALLTAALFGVGTYLADSRPLRAGGVLGMLCYKPHYFLLVPTALAAGRRWYSLGALAVTVTGLVSASILVYGWETWRAFFAFAPFVAKHSFDGTFGYWAYASWYSNIRLAGGPPWLALFVQCLAVAAAEAVTAVVWYRGSRLAVRGATLAAATLVAAPVMVSYDLSLAVVAVAWIYWDSRRTGPLPWEKCVLGVDWILALFGRNLGEKTHLPLLPLIGVSLLVLALRRCRAVDQSSHS